LAALSGTEVEEFGISESAGNGLVSTAADSNKFYYLTMFERKMLKTRSYFIKYISLE
jgi:hypothetical protein